MSAKFRTEKDSLGTLQVPADAYYGVQAARAVANFPISGMRAHPALILAYVQIKRAAAVTNLKLGMLDKPRADAIIKAADLVLADAAKLLKRDPQAVDRSGNLLDQWVIDVYQAGAGTSFNTTTSADGGGMFLIPAARITTYTCDDGGTHSWEGNLFGSLPEYAVFIEFDAL